MKEINYSDLWSLFRINTREDIKSFEVRDEYEDDHQQCAEVTINGIDCEFMWFDSVGFIHYWEESKKAFNELHIAIAVYVQRKVEELHEDGKCTDEEFAELNLECDLFFDALRAEYAAARK
jgi:hypothetical protein